MAWDIGDAARLEKGGGERCAMKYDGEMLARLVAQAEAQPMSADMVMIRALIEEASELGAGPARSTRPTRGRSGMWTIFPKRCSTRGAT
jgi:hypothetical protein